MVEVKKLGKNLQIVYRHSGDIYIEAINKPEFYEQTYVSITAHNETPSPQMQSKKYSITLIEKGKAHTIGYNGGKVDYFLKEVAIKKGIAWMKSKGFR